jgi:CRP-like cAMP-binding protein
VKARFDVAEDLSSLDELLEQRIQIILERLAAPHTLYDIESEITMLSEVVQWFKFRDELGKRLVEDNLSGSKTRSIRHILARHTQIVRESSNRIGELTAKSHQLISKTERLLAKLSLEKPAPQPGVVRKRNMLLAALSTSDYVKLIRHLERVKVPLDTVIYVADEPIEYVYFPESAVFSVVATMNDGASVEVGIIGNEGMLGIRALSAGSSTSSQTIAQIAGTAMRMRVEHLKDEFNSNGVLHELVLTYTQATIAEARQSAACKNFHSVDKRLATWLLRMNLYVEPDVLMLTQNQIAHMIGARLAGVSEAATRLRKKGLIEYHRGHIKLLDVQGLEAEACECHTVLRRELNRLLQSYKSLGNSLSASVMQV